MFFHEYTIARQPRANKWHLLTITDNFTFFLQNHLDGFHTASMQSEHTTDVHLHLIGDLFPRVVAQIPVLQHNLTGWLPDLTDNPNDVVLQISEAVDVGIDVVLQVHELRYRILHAVDVPRVAHNVAAHDARRPGGHLS